MKKYLRNTGLRNLKRDKKRLNSMLSEGKMRRCLLWDHTWGLS